MRQLSSQQLAVCSWSLRPADPQQLARQVRQANLSAVQLNLNPLLDQPDVWGHVKQTLGAAGIELVSGMFGCVGEDYSTLQTIRQTGGVVPDATWDQNWQNIQKLAPIARELGLSKVSTHAGFLPHDPADPDFAKLIQRLGQIADLLARHDIALLLETGQETADTLCAFLDHLQQAGHAPVWVNFDPANMILYDQGDPVAAVRRLISRVSQVHIKDATRTTIPGQWGQEVVTGTGQVDWQAFFSVLAEADFAGHLVIEREAGDQRLTDVQAAIDYLKPLLA